MKSKKIKCLFVCIAFFMMIFQTLPVHADEVMLSITCPDQDMQVSLYRVADWTENDKLTLTEPYKDYSVSLNQTSDEGWQGVANTLSDCIQRDGIQPYATDVSKADHQVHFSNLSKGLYLVRARNTEKYTIQVSLIPVSKDSNVSVILKYEKKEEGSSSNIQVKKVWKADSQNVRPSSIQVQLMQTDTNGHTSVVDTKTLNKENNWSYQWSHLSKDMSWSVLEKNVPSGYTESSIRQKDTIVLTNTYQNIKKEDSKHVNKKDQQLPYTGQLWWPVPVLVFLGMVCLFVSHVFSVLNKEKKKYDE